MMKAVLSRRIVIFVRDFPSLVLLLSTAGSGRNASRQAVMKIVGTGMVEGAKAPG
jgi:hypothetical protein